MTHTLDKIFARNFLLFTILVTLCIVGMGYLIISGSTSLNKSDNWIRHTYDVIIDSEELSKLVLRALNNQRGYIISGHDIFLQAFENNKKDMDRHIEQLIFLTKDNPEQTVRLKKIREKFIEFSDMLEIRAKLLREEPGRTMVPGLENVNKLQKEIMAINAEVLQDEYNRLNARIHELEFKRHKYFLTLAIGGGFCAILLLFLNGVLLHAQARRTNAEQVLKDTEERLKLAIEGSNDGIFDWHMRSGQIYFSAQYFKMLGHERPAHTGTIADINDFLHPDDQNKYWEHLDLYLNGELSEYSSTFRMKGASGRWVWIHSRAKAVFDKNGHALRLVGANTDITYMKQYEERLKDERDTAEKANQAKTDFLAHMSHEIRTPLTAISGIAEIFHRNNYNFDEKQKKLLSTLSTSTATLKDLVNDILDFSKIEGGELTLEQKNFDLVQLFQQVISIMSVKAMEKNLNFTFDYDGLKNTTFYGDQIRLRQILINLVGNALKFTEKGNITVKAWNEIIEGKETLQIAIIDTGIGIPESQLDAVFERFKQADSSVSRKFGGTGLGLPISKNLAMLMGGDISVQSTEGKGSRFTLALPALRVSEDIEKPTDPLTHRKMNDQVRAAIKGSKRVLVVEDYEGNIVVMSYILDDLQCEYDIAKNGLEALEMWKKHHYDVILMDVQMPVMDGFTATSEIRQTERQKHLPRTPVIGMTAHALVGDKDKCIAAGMDDYLPKPIVEADLKGLILDYFEGRRIAA